MNTQEFQEFYSAMQSLGFKYSEYLDDARVAGDFYKPLKLNRACEQGSNPYLDVQVIKFRDGFRLNVSISGEYSKQWFNLRATGMQSFEFLQNYVKIESSLVKAWEALG